MYQNLAENMNKIANDGDEIVITRMYLFTMHISTNFKLTKWFIK